jgi:hypothetical protein
MIELHPVDPANHIDVRNLAVRANQERFGASVEKPLADAYVWSDGAFRAAPIVGKVIALPRWRAINGAQYRARGRILGYVC